MNEAKDFLNSFFAAYPEAKNGELTREELNQLMAEHQRKLNSRPLEDFDGLSPEQMSVLLYNPLADGGGVLEYHKDIAAHVDKIPFFKLSEMLINEIQQAGSLKLTANGNLPVRVCELLCRPNLMNLQYMDLLSKRIKEEEVAFLWPLKQHLLDTGFVKKYKNALSLTKNAVSLLKFPEVVRFKLIFSFMASRYHWGNFFELDDDGKAGQVGWPYSLFLLSKYGDIARKSKFYSLKLMQAFEKDLWEEHLQGKESEAAKAFHKAYQYRFFNGFAKWFGLVNEEYREDLTHTYREELMITKSELFDQVFTRQFKQQKYANTNDIN